MDRDTVLARIDRYRDEVIELQRLLVATPALSPDYGEAPELTGESRKVELLRQYLVGHGITDITLLAAPDERVPGGVRPNLVARMAGGYRDRTAWVMAHIDVVPPATPGVEPRAVRSGSTATSSSAAAWRTTSRGCAAIFAARALMESGNRAPVRPRPAVRRRRGDRQRFGIAYMLEAQPDIFGPDDLIIVPDGGVPDGADRGGREGDPLAQVHGEGAADPRLDAGEGASTRTRPGRSSSWRSTSCTGSSTPGSPSSTAHLDLRAHQEGGERPQRQHHPRGSTSSTSTAACSAVRARRGVRPR